MSPAELKAEIEKRAVADPAVAALWADVFEPHPTKREALAHREGHLKPDAAFEIAARLNGEFAAEDKELPPEERRHVGHYEEVRAAKVA